MNIRRSLTYLAGLGFLVALGFGPTPNASAQVLPQPCEDCTTHDAQPGNGPGIFRSLHTCNVATGQGVGLYFLGNPNSTPVTYNFNSVSGDGTVEHNYTGTIPAGAGKDKPTVNIQVPDGDGNGTIHLVGTFAGRPIDQTFDCPCAQPDTTTSTTVPPPPSSTTPGGSLPPPATSPPGVTTPPTLPNTGFPTEAAAFWSIMAIMFGAFMLLITRRGRHDLG